MEKVIVPFVAYEPLRFQSNPTSYAGQGLCSICHKQPAIWMRTHLAYCDDCKFDTEKKWESTKTKSFLAREAKRLEKERLLSYAKGKAGTLADAFNNLRVVLDELKPALDDEAVLDALSARISSDDAEAVRDFADTVYEWNTMERK